MATYLLAWNRDKFDWGDLDELIRTLNSDGDALSDWSTGGTKKIESGDSFFMIRLGTTPRGICASGRFRSDVWEGEAWDTERAQAGGTQLYAEVEFDELVAGDEALLPQELLKERFPGVSWSPLASGITLPEEILVELEILWQSHLKDLGAKPYRLVQNRSQLRESIEVFWDALEDGHEAVRFVPQHCTNFIFDESTGFFAPVKWAALRGVTPVRYQALQKLQKPPNSSIRGFDSGRTNRHAEKLLDRQFAPDLGLAERVRAKFEASLGLAVWASDLSYLRFIRARTVERRYWWVNQGKSFEQEREGGFIWAPAEDEAGKSHYYWDNILDVGVADTILHYVKGEIRAVSVAESTGYADDDPKNPDEELEGWRADTKYHLLRTPLLESEVLPIVQRAELTQGPVGETGKVKQGYLFELPEAVAKEILSMVGETVPPLRSNGPEPPGGDMELNLILYGPPGTGKTYETIARAVEICDGQVPDSREATNARYRELIGANRIAFVTFHQSYSYEDFVEGIRPVLDGPEGAASVTNISYECRPGIFRRICSVAADETAGASVEIDRDSVRFWKMSLGDVHDPEEAFVYADAIDNNRLVLGYGGRVDYAGCDSAAEIAKRHPETEPGKPVGEQDFSVIAVDRLKNQMRLQDIVVVSDGNQRFRAIGRVTGDYQYVDRETYQHVRPVEWLMVRETSLPREMIMRKNFSQMCIYELKPAVLNVPALIDLLSSGGTGRRGNHVLIIDEINRGNISKILGELVTLLEPDKRLGARNEVTVTLPYSGDRFGVPSNLSVIATMNTADRSIAFLDTALRRRFTFEEMMPKPAVIRELIGAGGVLNGVNVATLLSVINERIEALYDRDHTIGHAYFLGIDSLAALRQVFLLKVIPLLQEYFYGDYAKICVVLGCPYDDSGKPVSKNKSPILVAKNLGSDLLAVSDDSYEARVHVEVSDEFKGATENELKACFQGVLSAVSAPAEDEE